MARLNFTLQIGNVGEVVDVEAQGLLLETQSGVTGSVVTSEALVNLPLNGRNFTALGNLTAGVVASGTQFRASGARGMYQQVSFDGVSALNNRGNNLFMYPSVDAVEEFKVQATNYTAEYGGHAGANVQLQLKSGSNSFHGSAFEFVRNDAMDARNYFAPPPTPKPELDRHQFGGVLGGPIRRGKTFFMGSYEGVRETRQTVAQTNVLTEEMRRGDFSGVAGAVVRDPLTGLQFRRQHHSGQSRGSAGRVDGQSVSAAAESDRRQQLQRLYARRGHPGSGHHAPRPCDQRETEGLRPLPLSASGQSHDPHQPGLSGAATVQQPQPGSSVRDHVERRDAERGPLRLHARQPQPAQPAPDDRVLG